ncbi:AAA family ATPase [Pseudomonas wadenswilerensis]
MKLIHIFIDSHKSIRSLHVSLGGPYCVDTTSDKMHIRTRADTTAYYRDHHCSAIIGANGVGKSSILDFIETSLYMTDSVGILFFFDDSDHSLHACCINMDLPETLSKTVASHDGLEDFAYEHNIRIVKINNITEAQSRLGYEKQYKHPVVQNRSLDNYSRLKSRRKRYFDNLLRYFRWSSISENTIEDVGFEFKFHDAIEKLDRSFTATKTYNEIQEQYENASRTLNSIKHRNRKDEHTPDNLTELLLAFNIHPIITDLSSESSTEVRHQLSLFLKYYFFKSLSFEYSSLQKCLEDSVEALRYSENWDIIKNSKTSISFSPNDIDIYRMQETLSRACNILRNISHHLCEIPRRPSANEIDIGYYVDDFYSVSEIIGLANQLPRNTLSNISWGWRGISTGEMARSHVFSETYDCLKKNKRDNTIIILDEADLYLHPEWQRSFLHSYLELLENINFSKKHKPQIILTTHSPIIVSDFLPDDIVSLTKDNHGVLSTRTSLGFGTNLTNLFIDGMHVDSTFGEHSRRVIVTLMQRAQDGSLTEFDRSLIKEMGNKYVRDYLLKK